MMDDYSDSIIVVFIPLGLLVFFALLRFFSDKSVLHSSIKVMFSLHKIPIPSLHRDNDNFVDVHGKWLAMISGVDQPPLILYERKTNKLLRSKILEFLDSSKRVLLIMGPPGVGKSVTGLTTIVREFRKPRKPALYVYIPAVDKMPIVESLFVSGYIISYNDGRSVNIRNVRFCLNDFQACCFKYQIDFVILDNVRPATYGVVSDSELCNHDVKILAFCSKRVKRDHSRSSISLHQVTDGWSLCEYETALAYDPFYASVCEKLRCFEEQVISANNTIAERKEIASAKFSIAGHSARWFFMDTGEILSRIDYLVNRIDATFAVHMGQSDCNDDENQILSRINNDRVLVSAGIARRIEATAGVPLIQSALSLLPSRSNPGADDILMELDFLSRLGKQKDSKKSPVYLPLHSRQKNPCIEVGRAVYRYVIPTKKGYDNDILFSRIAPDVSALHSGDWFAPIVFNNAGFDFVQYVHTVGKRHVLRFFQVTRAESHSSNRDHYDAFYKMFVAKYKFDNVKSEVYFVVERHHEAKFTVTDSTGTLTNFTDGQEVIVSFPRITV